MTKTYNIDVEWEIDEDNPPKKKLPTKVKNAKIEIDEYEDVLQQIEDWLADRYGCKPGSFYAGEIENPPKPEPTVIGFGTDFGLKRSGTIAIACTNCSHCQKSKRADWKCGIGDPMKMAERYGWCDKFNLRPRAVTMQIGRYREDVLIPSMKRQLGLGVASGEATEAPK